MTTQEWMDILRARGYTSINSLSRATRISRRSLERAIGNGKQPSIETIYRIATVLGIRIGKVVAMFYPEEDHENKLAVSKYNKHRRQTYFDEFDVPRTMLKEDRARIFDVKIQEK